MTTTIKFFTSKHLPEKLQVISKPFEELAKVLEEKIPECPEKSAGMRKLLEAKDCFVRSIIEVEE